MTFEIEVGGVTRTVSVDARGADARGGRFQVVVDGVPMEIDARPTDLGWAVADLVTGRVIDAALTGRAGGEWLVQLPRATVTAIVDGRRWRRGSGGDIAAAGEVRVTAPMPGRVLRLLVAAGDEVVARQGLVVVEAMKMENEIASPKAGRVKEVVVADGQSVEAGRVLVVVE